MVGLSFGVQVALEHYRRHPDQVRALVLICGTAGHPLDRVSPRSGVRRAFGRFAHAFAGGGRISTALLQAACSPVGRELAYLTGGAHRALCPREVLDGVFAHTGAMDPRVVGRVAAAYFGHDASDVLARVRVPTLIIAGDRDELTPVAVAERMQRAVAGSRLVVFPGHSHLVQVERPAEVHATIDQFLDENSL
jgi:pimeloyl-ACP methyl ester carboxylesterase